MKCIDTDKPDTLELAALGGNIAILCELATDLLDGMDKSKDYRLPQLLALLYTMKDRAEFLSSEVDRLN